MLNGFLDIKLNQIKCHLLAAEYKRVYVKLKVSSNQNWVDLGWNVRFE